MTSLRKIFGTIGLIVVFLFLSLFSIVEYQNEEASASTYDKSPIAAQTLNALGIVLLYLEKMPSLGLLPVSKVGNNYEQMMTEILTDDSSQDNQAKSTNLPIFWQELKENMKR